MTRKESHMVGKGISIIGSGVVGQATGIGLYMHGRVIVFLDIDKRKLEDLRKRGYTTTETICETVKCSDLSMISVPTHGKQAYRPPLCQGGPEHTEKSKPSKP